MKSDSRSFAVFSVSTSSGRYVPLPYELRGCVSVGGTKLMCSAFAASSSVKSSDTRV